MQKKQLQALIDFVKSGAGEQRDGNTTPDYDGMFHCTVWVKEPCGAVNLYPVVRTCKNNKWLLEENETLQSWINPAAESTKEQLLNLLLSLEVGEADGIKDGSLLHQILNFVADEDYYTVGQTIARAKFPFIQVSFDQFEAVKDRKMNERNGLRGAGYCEAIDEIAPEIISALTHARLQMQAEIKALEEKVRLLEARESYYIDSFQLIQAGTDGKGVADEVLRRYNQLQQS